MYQFSFSYTVYNESYEVFSFQNWAHLGFSYPSNHWFGCNKMIFLRELDIMRFVAAKGVSLTFYSFEVTSKHGLLSRKTVFLTITSLPWQRGNVMFCTVGKNQITQLCTKFVVRRLFRRKVKNFWNFDNFKFVAVKILLNLLAQQWKYNYNAVFFYQLAEWYSYHKTYKAIWKQKHRLKKKW